MAEDKLRSLAPAYDRIVTRMIPEDPEGDYDELERALRLRTSPAHRAEAAEIQDALDGAQHNAWRAHKLHIGARLAHELCEADAKIKLAPMRDGAVAALQVEKTTGARSKQITDADVESKMAEMWPDEWRAIALDRLRSRKAVDKFEEFAKLWGTRAQTLQAELGTARKSYNLID